MCVSWCALCNKSEYQSGRVPHIPYATKRSNRNIFISLNRSEGKSKLVAVSRRVCDLIHKPTEMLYIGDCVNVSLFMPKYAIETNVNAACAINTCIIAVMNVYTYLGVYMSC